MAVARFKVTFAVQDYTQAFAVGLALTRAGCGVVFDECLFLEIDAVYGTGAFQRAVHDNLQEAVVIGGGQHPAVLCGGAGEVQYGATLVGVAGRNTVDGPADGAVGIALKVHILPYRDARIGVVNAHVVVVDGDRDGNLQFGVQDVLRAEVVNVNAEFHTVAGVDDVGIQFGIIAVGRQVDDTRQALRIWDVGIHAHHQAERHVFVLI